MILAPNSNVTFCNPASIIDKKQAKITVDQKDSGTISQIKIVLMPALVCVKHRRISFAKNIFFMRLVFLSLALVGLTACNNSKEETKVTSKHSENFNSSVQLAMNSYNTLTEAFVNWDSSAVLGEAAQLQTRLSDIKLDEINAEGKQSADGSIALAKKDIQTIVSNNSLEEKRRGLNSLTQNLYVFLKSVQYDEKKVYLQKCPMAFNDTEEGLWLSEADSIRNPYLGLRHPKYGKGMLECGENKSVIDFTKGE